MKEKEEITKAEVKETVVQKKTIKTAEEEKPKKKPAPKATKKATTIEKKVVVKEAVAKEEDSPSPKKATAEEAKKSEAAVITPVDEQPSQAQEVTAEQTKETPQEEKKEQTPSVPSTPIQEDPFSMDDIEEDYSDEERKRMEKEYGETFSPIQENELIDGKVVGITDREVIVNINFKSDGLVSLSEFKDTPDLKVGDDVQVYLEEQENTNGQLVLSKKKAKIYNAWKQIESCKENDDILEGLVKRRTKGGLIMDILGIESFLPGSQIDVKPIRDFDIFVGKTMEVKIVKINYDNDNVVVSHKALIDKDIAAQKAVILNNLEKGQVLEGVIKNMTNFGVFIDLGGVDGLLHITDISWGRISHPEEVLGLDQKVNVVVLDFDDGKQRISLGMKQLHDHPWESLDESIDVGSKVKGKIVNVADYGAFLELKPGVEGLIHVSEMSWSQHLRNPSDFISVGDELEAVVLTLDKEERKMSLGIKQLTEDPWTKQDVIVKYAIGSVHKGLVRNLTNFGLFIELEEGIDGLVHVSDLSWTKKIKHPSEFVKVGEEMEVKVMELDLENKRVALSYKHLEENPWENFESIFQKGTTHKCLVLKKGDRYTTVELPYGLEGTVLNRNLKQENGSNAQEGESLEFMVTEFSKDEKRIMLSHLATWQKKEETTTDKKPSGARKSKTLDKINQEVEKSTLGDLDALSSLKEQMTQKSSEKTTSTEEKPVATKKTVTKKKIKKEESSEKKEEE